MRIWLRAVTCIRAFAWSLVLQVALAALIYATARCRSCFASDTVDQTGGFTFLGVSFAHESQGLRRLSAHERRWRSGKVQVAGAATTAWFAPGLGRQPVKPFKLFVTFADRACAGGRRRLVREAERSSAFDAVVGFQVQDIDDAFRARNRDIFQIGRGFGLWIWKPYFILKALEQLREGDILLYADAGCKLVGDPTPWLDLAAEHGWLVFTLEHKMQAFTKADVFAALAMPLARYGPVPQLVATVLSIQRRPDTLAFVREWLEWCTHARVLSDAPSTAPNVEEFVDHRHDQSVFSLLAYKHNISLILDIDPTYPPAAAKIIAAARQRTS